MTMRRTRKPARLPVKKETLRILTPDEAAAVVGGGRRPPPIKDKQQLGREISRLCLD